MSIILNTDSYKASHYCQYPENTEYVSSYIEARGGEYSKLVFFGLQAYLKKYLSKPITMAEIEQADAVLKSHGLPFFRAGWEYILKKHNGYLPLLLEAVPEGTVLNVGNVVCQVRNTDHECFWLTSYIETSLLRAIWYPTTVASRSYSIKQILAKYLLKTTGSLSGIDFMLHDFGARGCSSLESSELGGMAHLINFQGSDNLAAILAAREFYGADMAGYSIPAAEHGTITSWGQKREAAAYKHIIEQFSDYPAVSIVSDSYDLFNALQVIWPKQLKATISSYKGVVVIRPDSGDPLHIVQKCLALLTDHFGCVVNDLGFKVLPNNIRLIQGDGVSEAMISAILDDIMQAGFSAENLVFGMGAELLQKLDRDTLSFVMKVSAVNDGKSWFGVSKNPKTDSFKKSRCGRLALVDGKTIDCSELNLQKNMLFPVYENGKINFEYSWDDIRKRVLV